MLLSNCSKKTLFISFGLAKGFAFIAPIMLASFVSDKVYGTLEFYLSLSVLGGMIIGLGVPGAIPIQIVRNKEPRINALALWLLIIVAILIFFVGVIFTVFDIPISSYILILALIFLTFTQQICSPLIKSQTYSAASPWMDNLALNVLVLSMFLGMIFIDVAYISDFEIPILCFLSVTIFFIVVAIKRWCFFISFLEFFRVYKKTISIGFPILLNGIVMLLVFNSTRIYLGMGYEASDVANYSFVFRVLGAGVVVYQLFFILFFKEVYSSGNNMISRYCNALIPVVVFVIHCLFLAFYFGRYWIPKAIDVEMIFELFPIVAIQITIWILSGIMEARINSLGRSKESIKFMLVIVVLFCLFLAGFYQWLDVLGLCLSLAVLSVLALIAQVNIVNFNQSEKVSLTIPVGCLLTFLIYF